MSDPEKTQRGYRALRRGRVDIAHARYFLTLVTANRSKGLASEKIFGAISEEIESNPVHTLALVVMPDHLHWLFELPEGQGLSEIVRLFKGRLSPKLRAVDLAWQKGAYHDRRLRANEESASYLRYMLCNPYRAGLCAHTNSWPFWYCDSEVWSWFGEMTKAGRPHPEWIAISDKEPWLALDDQDV